jgi:hypothetical protein
MRKNGRPSYGFILRNSGKKVLEMQRQVPMQPPFPSLEVMAT